MKRRMDLFVTLWTAFVLFLTVGMHAPAADWPNWRGPDHNGISSETDWNPKALTDSTKPVWTASVGIGFSSISVSGGKAVTMGNVDKSTDVVTCFDAQTGSILWTYKYDEPLTPNLYEGGPNATPTIHEDKVYTISKTGKMFCLNLDNGDLLWQARTDAKKPEWGFAGSPLIVEDKVVYNVGTHGLALNKDTGEVAWQSGNDAAGYTSAVPFSLGGQEQLALVAKNALYSVDPTGGNVFWSYPWKTSYDINASDPIIQGNEILITSGYNHGAALIKVADNQPEMVWENKNMRSQLSGPVLIDGYLYGIDDVQLVCLDWKTGEKKWEEKSVGKGSLMAAGDKLIVLSEKGQLIFAQASPEKFTAISSAQILRGRCWTMPVLANGRIYARNAAGDMVCVDVQKENMSSLLDSEPVITAAVVESKSAAAAAVSKPVSADWPRWQGPSRDNKSPETGLLKKWPEHGPKLLWTAQNLGDGYSSPSAADQKIYVTGMMDKKGVLTCLDWNGDRLWVREYGPEWTGATPGVRCSPTIYDGLVYVISGQGKVACFDAETGAERWIVDPYTEYEGQMPRWGISMSPVIVNDKLIFIVGGKKATVVALDIKKGNVLWASESLGDRSSYSTPTVFEWDGRTIIVGMTYDHVFAVDAQNGHIFWQYPIKDYLTGRNGQIHCTTPVYHDGAVMFTSGYNMGAVRFSLTKDGWGFQKDWFNPEFDVHHGGVVYRDGYVYGSNWLNNGDGLWMCVDWKTGESRYAQRWHNKGSLIWADGLFYGYAEKDGAVGLIEADLQEFEGISEFDVTLGDGEHWAHPVISGKRLFIRHGDVLIVYDIAA